MCMIDYLPMSIRLQPYASFQNSSICYRLILLSESHIKFWGLNGSTIHLLGGWSGCFLVVLKEKCMKVEKLKGKG